uniref:Uncharacterized protein n=1 Tax=Ditylenchus dipsaci TaxID=166011 RepID=A0A915E6I6_9BILA
MMDTVGKPEGLPQGHGPLSQLKEDSYSFLDLLNSGVMLMLKYITQHPMCKWLSKATACYKQTGLFLALVFLFYGTEAKFGGGGFGRGGGGFFGRGGGGTRGGIGRSSGGVIYGGGYVGQSAPKRMPSGTSGGVIYSGGNVGQRVKAPPNIPRNSGNYHYPSNKGNMGSMNRKPIGAKPSIHHHHYHHYYSSQGIGSRPRSDQFKDMLVGAAAGHLIYKAGQSIINRPSDPFIWSGRPYYWTAYPVFINNNGEQEMEVTTQKDGTKDQPDQACHYKMTLSLKKFVLIMVLNPKRSSGTAATTKCAVAQSVVPQTLPSSELLAFWSLMESTSTVCTCHPLQQWFSCG